MWAAVAGRLHTPFKIYSFGDNSHDIMLFGTVEYTFKDGKKLTVRYYDGWSVQMLINNVRLNGLGEQIW